MDRRRSDGTTISFCDRGSPGIPHRSLPEFEPLGVERIREHSSCRAPTVHHVADHADTSDADTAIAPLPTQYRELFARARELLHADERVRAMWLSGSLARGTADAASDLDVILTIDDEHREDFAGSWRSWLSQITPTVLAEELPFARGSFYSVTPTFTRLDVVVESVSDLVNTFFRTRTVVFDHDGLAERLPAPAAGSGPSGTAVSGLITEFFRVSAVETILVRDDWLLAREHLHVLSSLIYRLFVEANAPIPAMGVKQWSTKLTVAQQDVLLALPVTATNKEQLAEAQQLAAAVFVTNAEQLARRLGVPWPTHLELAACQHIQQWLEIPDPYPRNADVVV